MTQLNKLLLSHSSMNTPCERMFFINKILNPPRNQNRADVAPSCGIAIHHGYQQYLRTGDQDQATYAMLKHYPYHLVPLEDQKWSMEACYAAMMKLYSKRSLINFEPVDIICRDEVTRTAIEVPFQINFRGLYLDDEQTIPIAWQGLIDSINYDTGYDKYVIVDVKATTWNLKDQGAKFQNSPQPIPYSLVLNQIAHQSLTSFKIVYIIIYVDILNSEVYIEAFDKSQDDVNAWINTTLYDIMKLQYMYKTKFWPMRGDQCINKYGGKCSHFEYCNEPTDAVNDIVHMVNIDKPWQFPTPWIELDLELKELVT